MAATAAVEAPLVEEVPPLEAGQALTAEEEVPPAVAVGVVRTVAEAVVTHHRRMEGMERRNPTARAEVKARTIRAKVTIQATI